MHIYIYIAIAIAIVQLKKSMKSTHTNAWGIKFKDDMIDCVLLYYYLKNSNKKKNNIFLKALINKVKFRIPLKKRKKQILYFIKYTTKKF